MTEPLMGLDKVLKNLNKEIDKIKGKSTKGMVRALLHVKRKTAPKIPIVTGNLRASNYVMTRTELKDAGGAFSGDNAAEMASEHMSTISKRQAVLGKLTLMPVSEIGFTAMYAAFVHENPNAGKQGALNDPKRALQYSEVGEWKFLQTTLFEETPEILRLIAKEAKL